MGHIVMGIAEEIRTVGRWVMFVITLVGLYMEYLTVSEAFICIIGLGVWNQLTHIATLLCKVMDPEDKEKLL